MGNCAAPSRHDGESWADDGECEETSSSSEDGHRYYHHHRASEEEHMSSEVTIRITKRQLHELMARKAPSGSGKTSQLLTDIMNAGEVHHHDEHREEHWRPALQSIPEAGESSAPCIS
ncbi:unnamed protein product [Alopecurus aequalis]